MFAAEQILSQLERPPDVRLRLLQHSQPDVGLRDLVFQTPRHFRLVTELLRDPGGGPLEHIPIEDPMREQDFARGVPGEFND